MKIRLFLIVSCVLLGASFANAQKEGFDVPSNPSRAWTEKDSTRTIKGRMISVSSTGIHVVIEKDKENPPSVVWVEIEKLSDADKKYIKDFLAVYNAPQNKIKREVAALIRGRTVDLRGKIKQVTAKGVLVSGELPVDGTTQQVLFFLVGFDSSNSVDGDPINLQGYPIGTFQYTNVMGSTTTVRKFHVVNDDLVNIVTSEVTDKK